jgi:glutamate dehydrogenase (NADP+)
MSWTREEVDMRLKQIMESIHKACVDHGTGKDGYINYVKGANIAGFMKVANTMCDLGLIM